MKAIFSDGYGYFFLAAAAAGAAVKFVSNFLHAIL